ncbi:hypothetical protein J2X12_002899 [Pseudarthrobacter oxydans]|uniref:Gp28/Gp37-like domain-containing protein n=1 Tax=Pseudarthrobacter oxydans TaxID=1671 RepID=A0AAW8NDD3_PSEOX|nr:hypothetical protein [Pseudarthrobacter oxydans]MDR6794364.1 hypothetical protein [Pseudarthrobacter oxydans]MDR7164861.1 hypothetical protein [Pseudarthrobacter oxydans]
METNPFKITVYDRNLVRKGFISTPSSLRAIPRHNLKGTATFQLALDHPMLGDLMAEGSRVVIDYRGKQAMSGPVTARSINGPSISGSATFQVEDDFRVLHSVLGWPVPSDPITNQLGAERYVLTGPAETVVKTVFAANAINRLGMNYAVAPDQGRGDVITLEIRMETLYEKLFPAVEAAGLGVSVKQVGSQLVLDCYVPSAYAPILSEESGIVQDWSWTNNAPTVTDAIMGGRGEAAAREFRAFADSAAASLWGFRAERFEDGRNVGADLNNWYNRHENATGALQRAEEKLAKEQGELSQITWDTRNADVTLSAIYVTHAAGTPEREAAEDTSTQANNAKTSATSAVATAVTARDEKVAELAAINAEYAAIRAAYEEMMAAQGAEALAAGGEKTGIRMVLSETDAFRYGESVNVGDKVTMRVGPNLTLTDTLREAELTWTFENGVTATPSVGEITDNPDRVFAKALRNSVTRIRKIEVR